nr:MAG TPA: hypothetical protein [Caudoviricetes sp.]
MQDCKKVAHYYKNVVSFAVTLLQKCSSQNNFAKELIINKYLRKCEKTKNGKKRRISSIS